MFRYVVDLYLLLIPSPYMAIEFRLNSTIQLIYISLNSSSKRIDKLLIYFKTKMKRIDMRTAKYTQRKI